MVSSVQGLGHSAVQVVDFLRADQDGGAGVGVEVVGPAAGLGVVDDDQGGWESSVEAPSWDGDPALASLGNEVGTLHLVGHTCLLGIVAGQWFPRR